MKIEIGESLCYSYLRHVKQCWVVQLNWKVSEHWAKLKSDDELEKLFESMRGKFDPDGSVFKKTKDAGQFLKQGEIDVVGVGQDGSVHALDVAFHEAGLNYGGGADKRVLKKLLRAVMILKAYCPQETKLHVYFASPKVHRAVQQPLEDVFARLREEYPEIGWHLLTNDGFADRVVWPTLEKAALVADTSELYVRAAELEDAINRGLTNETHGTEPGRVQPLVRGLFSDPDGSYTRQGEQSLEPGFSSAEPSQLQSIVRVLMKTLLEDYPDLLSENNRQNLMRTGYCEGNLGLQLGGYALLRPRKEGRMDGRHFRYWQKVYGGRYYVTNNWWRQHHVQNARSLLRFVSVIVEHKTGHLGIPTLERVQRSLEDYIG